MSDENVPVKEEKKEESKDKGLKKGEIRGNVNRGYVLDSAEKGYVHFYSTDHSAPREQDPVATQKMPRTLSRMHPEIFVQLFKMNFENNVVNKSLNTAEKLYRVVKNLSPEIVNVQWEDEITRASIAKGISRRDVRSNILKKKSALRMNGGLIVVKPEDILHVPGLDPKNANEFPKECLFDILEDDI